MCLYIAMFLHPILLLSLHDSIRMPGVQVSSLPCSCYHWLDTFPIVYIYVATNPSRKPLAKDSWMVGTIGICVADGKEVVDCLMVGQDPCQSCGGYTFYEAILGRGWEHPAK